MKYILAISGGIDSVVLLDMATRGLLPGISSEKKDLIVTHFDHGIRKKSHVDCDFVRNLARRYGLEFIYERANLGKNASEEVARKARYDFLWRVAKENQAKIVTAHHQDDLVETILINLFRGTGWRGLAPFVHSDILRPLLLNFTKTDLVAYAIERGLHWVEDETNYNFKYFRNRVRVFASKIDWSYRQKILEIYRGQIILRKEIESILDQISSGEISKKWINSLPRNVATEVFRCRLDGRLTNLQTDYLLDFLQHANSGNICQPGGHLQIKVYKDTVIISKL